MRRSLSSIGTSLMLAARQARRHKEAFRAYLHGLAAACLPGPVADHLYLLAEGAMVTAAIFKTAEPALQAASAAENLLAVARPAASGRLGQAPGPRS
jgi:hypothetical protein